MDRDSVRLTGKKKLIARCGGRGNCQRNSKAAASTSAEENFTEMKIVALMILYAIRRGETSEAISRLDHQGATLIVDIEAAIDDSNQSILRWTGTSAVENTCVRLLPQVFRAIFPQRSTQYCRFPAPIVQCVLAQHLIVQGLREFSGSQ